MNHLVIAEFDLPERPDHPDWVDYQRLCRLEDFEVIAGTEWDNPDDDALVDARSDRHTIRRRFLAREGDVAVGYGRIVVTPRDDPAGANVNVFVDPEFRGRGIGRAIAEAVRAALGAEIERATAWVPTPLPSGELLIAGSGIGAVPAGHPGVRLALAFGFRMGQAERVSRYDFASPLVEPEVALADARAVAEPEYEVVTYEGASPEEYLADLAALKQRMSTDPPMGEMTVVESDWDAERVREMEADLLQTNRLFRALGRHVASGRIVALNELLSPRSRPTNFVDQWDTIVHPDHRGHRLGMLVKAANLIQVRAAVPESPAIVTYNAEENRHMLSVNEALGFRPIGMEGAFEAKR